MASFRQFTASPVLTMPPAHQGPFGMAGFAHQHTAGHAAFSAAMPFPPPSVNSFSPKPSTSSRKRSRDEASINLEPDLPAPAPQESEDDWVYGEGMVLIKANKGYVADASSQSGTWIEEKKANEDKRRQDLEEERVRLVPRSKSQRLDRAFHAAHPSVEPSVVTNTASPTNNTNGPVIDNFTLHLGIGWRKISDDEHIQAAARGWARYIENHYPLSNVCITLESNGLQSYLVEASEGFFLFAENLRTGRLVSTNADGAMRNLQTSPPTFEGMTELTAAATPPATEPQRQLQAVDTEMNMD